MVKKSAGEARRVQVSEQTVSFLVPHALLEARGLYKLCTDVKTRREALRSLPKRDRQSVS